MQKDKIMIAIPTATLPVAIRITIGVKALACPEFIRLAIKALRFFKLRY